MSTVHSDPVVTDDGTDPADGTDLDAATDPVDAADFDGAAGLSAKQARILRYLREHAAERTYFKSRLIADDLGLSAKEVGANMGAVADAATAVDVEKWGYSSGTTWMVTS